MIDRKFLESKFSIIHSVNDKEDSKCLECGDNEPSVRGMLNGNTSSGTYNYPDLKVRSSTLCRNCYTKSLRESRDILRYTKVRIKTCKICTSIFVTRYSKSIYCNKKCVQKARNSRDYKRYDLKCGYCEKEFTANRKSKYCSNICRNKIPKPPKEKFDKECKKCGKSFLGNGNFSYCSDNCSPWRKSDNPVKVKCISCESMVIHPKKKCDPCKSKKPEKEVYNKTCPTCESEFQTTNKTKIYCKSGHSPSSREFSKLRKRAERTQKLKCESWRDIADFKKNRPKNYQLDHIIPLNHPDVCGLHNTWNFQWLPKDDNKKKSNKFDGTMENSSWKK